MTKITLALLIASTLGAQAAEKRSLPVGLRCASVKQSAVGDLPRFCRAELDKRRLVDYGFQLDALETCGESELAKSLKTALQAKVHRADNTSCAEIAAGMAGDLEEEKAE